MPTFAPSRGLEIDNRPVQAQFMDSNPISEGFANLASSVVNAGPEAANIRRQQEALALQKQYHNEENARAIQAQNMQDLYHKALMDNMTADNAARDRGQAGTVINEGAKRLIELFKAATGGHTTKPTLYPQRNPYTGDITGLVDQQGNVIPINKPQAGGANTAGAQPPAPVDTTTQQSPVQYQENPGFFRGITHPLDTLNEYFPVNKSATPVTNADAQKSGIIPGPMHGGWADTMGQNKNGKKQSADPTRAALDAPIENYQQHLPDWVSASRTDPDFKNKMIWLHQNRPDAYALIYRAIKGQSTPAVP